LTEPALGFLGIGAILGDRCGDSGGLGFPRAAGPLDVGLRVDRLISLP
jgi:hypothetical protein